MKAETRTQHKLTRTPSDPDIALYDDDTAAEITPLELEQLDTLRTALLDYHNALDAVGLPDERVRRDAPQGTLSLLYGALLRALWAVLLLVLAAPGTLVLSPLLLCGKGLEIWIILTNRGARRVRNLDEVSCNLNASDSIVYHYEVVRLAAVTVVIAEAAVVIKLVVAVAVQSVLISRR
jgi:hypothetical protein